MSAEEQKPAKRHFVDLSEVDPLLADRAAPSVSVRELAQSALERLARDMPDRGSHAVIDTDTFCDRLLAGDAEAAIVIAEGLREEGAEYAALVEALFADAARLLGGRWDKSELSFVQVSLGISTLLRVNTVIRRSFPEAPVDPVGRILFATLRDQSHTIGLVFAAEAFRQNGLDVEMRLGCEAGEIVEDVEKHGFGLVGLTAGHEDRLSEISWLARRLKRLPAPPRVLLGGVAAERNPRHVSKAEVDWVVADLREAFAATREYLEDAGI
ncbi:MAG: cobalamin-dependent protein [Paracoccaceae bacterium]|nr:cobalamin-dependent protein [Paracoccaceae bacterium]